MKAFYLLTVIAIGVALYLTYEKGQLAFIHPLLDPATHAESEPGDEAVTAVETPEETPPPPTAAKEDEESAKEAEEAKKKALLAEKRAEAAAKKAAEEQAKAEEAARKEAEKRAREQRRAAILRELEALSAKSEAIYNKISQAERNRRAQEVAWNNERIKTSDNEKNRLRQAADQYMAKLREEQKGINDQIRAKRKELREVSR